MPVLSTRRGRRYNPGGLLRTAMPHLIPIDRQARMRWRNGRGETREVAAFPRGATLDSFEWRVSIATIEQDGAFSRFPGVTRTTMLIAGAGLRLTGQATRIELAGRHATATYRGDDEVNCKLLGGVVQVFNAMVRGNGPAHVTAMDASMRAVAPARFRVCVALEGAVHCACDARRFALEPGDALVIDEPDERDAALDVRVRAGAGAAIAVRIDSQDAA
jgi:environmental stress-induced protein Ves